MSYHVTCHVFYRSLSRFQVEMNLTEGGESVYEAKEATLDLT